MLKDLRKIINGIILHVIEILRNIDMHDKWLSEYSMQVNDSFLQMIRRILKSQIENGVIMVIYILSELQSEI